MIQTIDNTKDHPRVVAVAANPYSGSKHNKRRVAELVHALETHNLEPRPIWDQAELKELANDPAFVSTCRCLVSAGGDGTLNGVINRQTALPVAMFPLGNENLFAREFRQPADPNHMAEMVVHGYTEKIDLGRADDVLFTIVTSVGLDGDVANRLAEWRQRDDHLKRVGRVSYLRPLLQSLREYQYPTLEVTADDRKLEGSLVMVFNIGRYGMHLPLVADADHRDGLLDYIVFEKPGTITLFGYALAVWFNQHRKRKDVHVGRAKSIRINCHPDAPMEIDGEGAGYAPTRIHVVPNAMTVVVPPPTGNGHG